MSAGSTQPGKSAKRELRSPPASAKWSTIPFTIRAKPVTWLPWKLGVLA